MECYGGGDIAGAVFGTLIVGCLLAFLGWWLYKNYWKNRKDANTQLVNEDPENAKHDFAFDNPAFKGDNNKGPNNVLDTKWNHGEKRKTVDDSYAGVPKPQLVSLRGSDFTGLGIEVYGGLKDGIFVKKVMPQGPAAGIVKNGDRITSITIDFQHIAQEDATTILSYASPYNVQLEIVDGKHTKLNGNQHSPKGDQNHSLTHPFYRSSSQEDIGTIERNSRKKMFPNEDSNYPTLKMEQQRQSPSNKMMPSVHKENEKRSTLQHFKNLIEDTFQTRSHSHDISPSQELPPDSIKMESEKKSPKPDDGKKGLKFGIRVLPPNVNEKLFGKSPTKTHPDEHTVTIETQDNLEKKVSPPVAMKRTKPPTVEEINQTTEFERMGDVTSSGIRRDAAGIPQEVPNHMMNAALAALGNRKSNLNSSNDDLKKSKGKAPKPPAGSEMNVTTEAMVSTVSVDMPDAGSPNKGKKSDKMNFTDNFVKSDDDIQDFDKHKEEQKISNTSTPKSDMKMQSSDTESNIEPKDIESDLDLTGDSKQIELNGHHITVHQSSEEDTNDEERRTASLGDLSKFENTKLTMKDHTDLGTLERAQSLEIKDPNVPIPQKIIPKKRMSTDLVHEMERDAKIMNLDLGNMNTLERGRLKSANEWGNLEDAIFDKNGSMEDRFHNVPLSPDTSDDDLVKQVMAAADRFDENMKHEIEFKRNKEKALEQQMELGLADLKSDMDAILAKAQEEAEKVSNTTKITDEIVIVENTNQKLLNGFDDLEKAKQEVFNYVNNELPKKIEESINQRNLIEKPVEIVTPYENGITKHEERVTISPVLMNQNDDKVRIINYGVNVPDDVKVSRYSFDSLERPKSDVFKKLMGKPPGLNRDDHTVEETKIIKTTITSMEPSKITVENGIGESQPVSLTFIGSVENDLTESSQVSPVYSSDGQGVNSINISSMEVSIRPDHKNDGLVGMENIVTINTESSQPSSIIMIDDEKLDFTLQLPDELKTYQDVPNRKDEVFVVESLSSKKIPDQSEEPRKDIIEAVNNTFVTEIKLKTPERESTTPPRVVDEQSVKKETVTKVTANNLASHIPKDYKESAANTLDFIANERRHLENEYFPKNSKMKFTTTTYEASPPRLNTEKRSSIDSIRSNFELKSNGTSEIPVAVRKSSIPTLRTSPSRIPVLNSSKSQAEIQLKNNGVQNNRVSVSVMSIKNSSKHPSGGK